LTCRIAQHPCKNSKSRSYLQRSAFRHGNSRLVVTPNAQKKGTTRSLRSPIALFGFSFAPGLERNLKGNSEETTVKKPGEKNNSTSGTRQAASGWGRVQMSREGRRNRSNLTMVSSGCRPPPASWTAELEATEMSFSFGQFADDMVLCLADRIFISSDLPGS
jgi:hypothetical protein